MERFATIEENVVSPLISERILSRYERALVALVKIIVEDYDGDTVAFYKKNQPLTTSNSETTRPKACRKQRKPIGV